MRSQRARALVAQTVIRARVDVHEVLGGGSVEALVHLLQLATPVDAHGRGTVVLLLQELTYTPEISQLQPASLQTAGTGNTVALTRHVSQIVHRLERNGDDLTVWHKN